MHTSQKNKRKRSRHGHPWLKKELEDLQTMYRSRTDRALELHFGRSSNSIRHKATELGLKRPRKKTRQNRRWSKMEIQLLRELYPDTPVEEIASELIGRSLQAIHGMAHILGVSRANSWTEEEVAQLRRLWPDSTLAELAEVLNRSERAVKSKANRLGLRRPRIDHAGSGDGDKAIVSHKPRLKRAPRRPWSQDEVTYLKHAYPTTPSEKIARNLECRSITSIRAKAFELGLTQKRTWTTEEDNAIREHYLRLSWREIAERLNRSTSGVQLRARALGLKRKPPRVWTRQEDRHLLENWSKLEAATLAKQLDRTVVAVTARARILGVSEKRNWWREQDEAFLLEHWQDKSYLWIAQQLNRPVGTVRSYAEKLGLRKQRHHSWTEQEIQVLKTMHGHVSTLKIARRLKRSVHSVRAQMTKLGLTTPHPGKWTIEEKEHLKTLYGRSSLKEMAEKLGRSVHAVQVKITELGLARKKRLQSAQTKD